MNSTKPNPNLLTLGTQAKGFVGRIRQILANDVDFPLGKEEMERRLIELGFVEGADIAILDQGLFGRDPIGVQVNSSKVALRRHEAMAIFVEATPK